MRYRITLVVSAVVLLTVLVIISNASRPRAKAIRLPFQTSANPVDVDGTADPFITQVTNSFTSPSFATDISGDGRFVVVESVGDIATESPDNTDGNREIFLYDYGQRRIFQITHTTSALLTETACATPTPTPTPSPSPSPSPEESPSPSPSPTPIPTPTPVPYCAIDVEVNNNKPAISHDGRYLVFTSNALNPGSFDGADAANHSALSADGNQEVWIYQLPFFTNVDLADGSDGSQVDLAHGTFSRITDTPASRLPQPGTITISPFVAFDNRDVAVNDDASVVSFTSSRNITNVSGLNNSDGSPEIFVYQRSTNAFAQLTSTQGSLIFSGNPSLSGDGSVVAFISNANISESSSGAGSNSDGNAEIYVANFNGTAATNLRQVTKTTASTAGVSVNILSPGRHLSRNGNLLAFESSAELAGDNSIQSATTSFIYDLTLRTFTKVGPRADSGGDVLRFPTFSGDGSTIVFASSLNFNADGSAPATDTDGLNPDRTVQVFSSSVTNANSFTRLTNTPASVTGSVAALQPFVSDTTRRISFSLAGTELGGVNSDLLAEVFYLLVPPQLSEVPAADNVVSYLTGASLREVISAPSPSPTPTPPAVATLAPGMLAIMRSSTQLAPAEKNVDHVQGRRYPSLPVELGGVSVSINGAAAGLYYVSEGQINFVVPPGLSVNAADATYGVVINNNGAVIRSVVQLFAAQPDIFTSTNGPDGSAVVFNITNPHAMVVGPFTVTSTNLDGETVATVLRIIVTGGRGAVASDVTVRIKDTDISGVVYVGPTDTPGFDQIDFTLPDTLAGVGDVPIIVTISSIYSSRASDTGAPHIVIN